MADMSRLAANWYRWAPSFGGGEITIVTDEAGTHFRTDDYQVHLHRDASWWVVDTVNDRGQRRNGDAELSSFNLAEKYLIWDWSTAARAFLAAGPLGAELYKRGYAPSVEVTDLNGTHARICLGVMSREVVPRVIGKPV